MNNLQTIIIYLSILLIVLLTAKFIANLLKPVINDTKSEFINSDKSIAFDKYINAVYNSSFPDVLVQYNLDNHGSSDEESSAEESNEEQGTLNIQNTLRFFNFIFDNAPRQILDLYPIAENLSFSWPPKMGSRYKLTAFPYPKSKNTLLAVYGTISNTIDAYTFPGWSIQRRNPLDFNNSIYNNGFFRPYQYIEVLHACYPPPGAKYPLCDDGGWWLYYAAGSGVFWNTGKCIISNNKLSCLYDIYKCSTRLRREIQMYNDRVSTVDQKPLPDILGYSIADLTRKFEGKGGGKSIMLAIFTIVQSLNKHSKPPAMIGFKNLTPSDNGGNAWTRFIMLTFFILYLIAVIMIQFFINIRGKSWQVISGLTVVCLILIASMYYYFLYVVFEDFFRGLGWMTLDMALDQSGMNLYEFVSEAVTGNQKNPMCNSLAMVQFLDLDLEAFVHYMGYDSFILTSQPNKTGTWEVEICDLRRYDPDKKGIAEDGGVCNTLSEPGNNKIKIIEMKDELKDRIDICSNKILPRFFDLYPDLETPYQLMTGPIVFDKLGPPFYRPTKPCDCQEYENRLCTSCSGTLSGKLCINK